ncbi:hypothetical protein [Stenotrophomonas phage BUCT608]|nr:putative tail tube associated base plate protein [Stenotrophomonas phage BUCT608]QYC97438.1 hypothetical protein [Stenotrophomonas phage BUCT608]
MADLVYPKSLRDPDANPGWIQFNFFERDSPKESSPIDKIALYMPESISQPSTVSWDSEKFGFIGNAVAAGAAAFNRDRSLGGAMQAAQTAFGQMEGGSDVLMARAMANLGSAAVGLMGGNVSAEGLMGAVAGKIFNPYMTMVFRGIDFRNFAFTFKFVPFSEKDCDTIDEIVKTFRKNQLPEWESGRTFLGYPNECQISYKWKDQDNKWLHKFKRAVCTAVDVDYTPAGGFNSMRNGMPATITVSTKWNEIELVTRKDVDEGF